MKNLMAERSEAKNAKRSFASNYINYYFCVTKIHNGVMNFITAL